MQTTQKHLTASSWLTPPRRSLPSGAGSRCAFSRLQPHLAVSYTFLSHEQGWFDPSTRDKINVLGNPAKDTKTRETLKSHIDEANLPTMYGGTLQWQTGDKPNFDEPARKWLTEALGSVDAFRGPQEIDPDMAIGDTASDGGDSGVGLDDDHHKPRISRPPQVPATVSVGA